MTRLERFYARFVEVLFVLILAYFVICASGAWGATYYLCNASSGDGSGDSYANCESVTDHNADTFAGGDTVYLCDNITTQLIPPSSGTNKATPITYDGACPGHPGMMDFSSSILSGEWSQVGSTNVWQQTLGARTNTIKAVWFNGYQWGTLVANATAPAMAGDFFWDGTGGVFYVYATSSPATYYTDVRIPLDTYKKAILVNAKDNITIKNMTIRRVYGILSSHTTSEGCISNYHGDNITIQDNTLSQAYAGVLFSGISTGGRITGNTISDMYCQVAGPLYTNGAGSGVRVYTAGTEIDNNVINMQGYVMREAALTKKGNGIAVTDLGSTANYDSPIGCSVHENTISYTGGYGINVDDSNSDVGEVAMSLNVYQNVITNGPPGTGDTDCIGIGGDSGADSYMSGINVYRNWCEDFGNTCVLFANYTGKNSVAWSNICKNTNQAGASYNIRLKNGAHAYNNTLYDTDKGHAIVVEDDTITGGVEAPSNVSNNIIHTVRTANKYGIRVVTEANATGGNNVIYGVATEGYETLNFTNTNGRTDDPLLDSDLRPAANSPALWQRATLGSPYDTDYDGLWFGDRGAPIGAMSQGNPRSRNTASIH